MESEALSIAQELQLSMGDPTRTLTTPVLQMTN
jgi:hypothetical protein